MNITTLSHESPLGQWTHSECAPRRLSQVVEKVWHFEGRMSVLRERSFPRVYSEIILHLGPRYRDVDANGNSLDFFPQACFAGAMTTPAVVEAPDESCCVIGIRLHAVGAFLLSGSISSQALDATVSLDDALGNGASCLAERCFHAPSVRARFELICAFLQRRLATHASQHDAIDWASRQLRVTNGQAAIATLQQQTSFSKARFIAEFRAQTGMTPKQYARILRFRNSLSLLQSGSRLGNAALSAGYYDQAHMYRDFAEFAQMTPNTFVRAERFPNSISLAEPN